MQKTVTLSATLLAFAALTGSALAQVPPPPPAPPVHHGLFGRMFHPKPGQPMQGHYGRPGQPMRGSFGRPGQPQAYGRPGLGTSIPTSGSVIGNKNTHVYHMAGDRGAMPAAQNRVYFPSASAAQAAGYRPVGGAHSMTPGRRPMMHGSPRTGTPMPGSMTR